MADIVQLVIQSDGGVKRFPLGIGAYVIGREPGCDLVIDSFFISRRHARITIAADHFEMEDLQSTSGTLIGGQSLMGTGRFSYPQEGHLGSLSMEVQRLVVAETQIPAPPAAKATAGHYTPGKEIAKGGMGAVLEANDEVLGRTVAMKVILSGVGESSSMRLRFIQEATVLARLEHPSIVPIYEMGKAGKVTRERFTAFYMDLKMFDEKGAAERLDKWDVNHDGFLSREEFITMGRKSPDAK